MNKDGDNFIEVNYDDEISENTQDSPFPNKWPRGKLIIKAIFLTAVSIMLSTILFLISANLSGQEEYLLLRRLIFFLVIAQSIYFAVCITKILNSKYFNRA